MTNQLESAMALLLVVGLLLPASILTWTIVVREILFTKKSSKTDE